MALLKQIGIKQIGKIVYTQYFLDKFWTHVMVVIDTKSGCMVRTDGIIPEFNSSFTSKECMELACHWNDADRQPFILDMQRALDKPKRIAVLKPKVKKYLVSRQTL